MSFLDTNVLIHATAARSPQKGRAQSAIDRATLSGSASISRQTLREYLAVMTRSQPWGDALTMSEAMSQTTTFGRLFRILEDGPRAWTELQRLCRSVAFGGKQVHDANMVATMLAHGEIRLLTFNAKHFRRFEPMIEVVEP